MPTNANPEVTPRLRDRIISQVAETVRACYVFEEDGHRMSEGLLTEHGKGSFNSINQIPDLTAAISQTLQDIRTDLHLVIGAWMPTEDNNAVESDNIYKEWLQRMPRCES